MLLRRLPALVLVLVLVSSRPSSSNHEPICRVPPDERKRGERRDDGREPRIPLLRHTWVIIYYSQADHGYANVPLCPVPVHGRSCPKDLSIKKKTQRE